MSITTDLPVDLTGTTPTSNLDPEPIADSSAGEVFALTSVVDRLLGTAADDIFEGTFIQNGTGTFNIGDVLDGGGGTADTLSITVGAEAINPTDNYWSNITNIENVVFNTTGAGAQTITTGGEFNRAFATAGVGLTAQTTSGAINIDMSAFTGDAAITAITSVAGAQTIVTGNTGTATVTATSNAGAQTITGANLGTVTATAITGAQTIVTGNTGIATVTAISNAGAQTITGGNLGTVTATVITGEQTIISTGAGAVTVDATSGSGATTIVTGAGNDTITLYATDAVGANTITGGAGADTITLVTGDFAAKDTIVQADGDSKTMTTNTITGGTISAGQTITFGNGLDIINGFVGGTDVLSVGTVGAAIAGIGQEDVAFTVARNIFLSGDYLADTGIFTIAADGLGADTLLLDTAAAGDQTIATADTWTLLAGTNSGTLIASSFI